MFDFYELACGYSGYWVEFLSVLLNFVTPTQTPHSPLFVRVVVGFYRFLSLIDFNFFISNSVIRHGEFQTKNRFRTMNHGLFIDLLFHSFLPIHLVIIIYYFAQWILCMFFDSVSLFQILEPREILCHEIIMKWDWNRWDRKNHN